MERQQMLTLTTPTSVGKAFHPRTSLSSGGCPAWGTLITAHIHTKMLVLQFLPASFNFSQVKAIHKQKEAVTPKIYPVQTAGCHLQETGDSPDKTF